MILQHFNILPTCCQHIANILPTCTTKAYCKITDRGTKVQYFLNGITDPVLAQAKLSLPANPDKHASDFDVTVKNFTNQVLHRQVNQHHNIAAIAQGAPKTLETWKQEPGIRNVNSIILTQAIGLAVLCIKS